MKVENIKCLSVKAENEKLVLSLVETSFAEVKEKLVGKDVLSVYTDNETEPVLVEEHYDYAKADSLTFDFDKEAYVLTLRKLSKVEKELAELKALILGKA
ncbi:MULTISPECIES: hypothetical protein [Parabacteroides]|uniref:hypothetical protein n=1 Tax=Parabacteroides TaxID=375288 RepID=UPI0011DD4C03|nr:MULTISPECIES: hypothetical protein [Parabacteroides]MBP3519610.1 hypothetical protein [Parabacteroides sp.]MBU9059527.1 hypothetical protein [Parabacteroides merdae]MCG4837800.1 hypothetical protein [Parabacteroides merdae]MCQ5194973.1 hypothetical protein [Parabacteroides merdae]